MASRDVYETRVEEWDHATLDALAREAAHELRAHDGGAAASDVFQVLFLTACLKSVPHPVSSGLARPTPFPHGMHGGVLSRRWLVLERHQRVQTPVARFRNAMALSF